MLDFFAIKSLIDELQMKFEHRDLRKALVDVYNEMKAAREELEIQEANEKKKREEAEAKSAQAAARAAEKAAQAAARAALLRAENDEDSETNSLSKYSFRERRFRAGDTTQSTNSSMNKSKNDKNHDEDEVICEDENKNGFCTITRKMQEALGLSKTYSTILLFNHKLYYTMQELVLVSIHLKSLFI